MLMYTVAALRGICTKNCTYCSVLFYLSCNVLYSLLTHSLVLHCLLSWTVCTHALYADTVGSFKM